MFYLLAVLSSLSYALQSALFVRYARKIDGLSLAFYRNISFVVTLSPLLIGADMADFSRALSSWPMYLGAGLCGACALWCTYASYREIATGVSSAVAAAGSTVFTSILGVLFFGELLSIPRWIAIACVLAGCVLLALRRQSFDHLTNHFWRGAALAFCGGLPHAITKAMYADLSRSGNPLVSGYFWEVSIGVCCLLLILLLRCVGGRGVQRVSRRSFLIITACALPTLAGTGFYGLAATMGPLAILGAIGSLSLVILSLFAWKWYGEKMKAAHWLSIAIILSGVIGLKFA